MSITRFVEKHGLSAWETECVDLITWCDRHPDDATALLHLKAKLSTGPREVQLQPPRAIVPRMDLSTVVTLPLSIKILEAFIRLDGVTLHKFVDEALERSQCLPCAQEQL